MMNADLIQEVKEKLDNRQRLFLSPHPLLQRYISCYVFYMKPNPYHSIITTTLSIIPDASGCIVFTCYEDRMQGLLWGPTTEVKKVENSLADRTYFFVEFLPGGLRAFTGMGLAELRDKVVNLEDINKKLSVRIMEALRSTTCLSSFASRMNHLFLQLHEHHSNLNPLILSSMEYILQHEGSVRVKEVAHKHYISERQLQRSFQQHVGINVKKYASIVQFNQTIHRLKRKQDLPLSSLTNASGFFDESHMISTFHKMIGLTPRTFKENMSDFYNDAHKFPCKI
ncbi:helix-turn-helix domain-containing protein [Gracilibacillus dipsosauri]|uniref:helix-turn-helix domain-containing protein n=1 Tax=Gracilibacillus dipsosauri TaxID=178340 RepID=UPI002409E36C